MTELLRTGDKVIVTRGVNSSRNGFVLLISSGPRATANVEIEFADGFLPLTAIVPQAWVEKKL